MGWSEDDIEGIRVAGLLHDIGKLAVDKTVINKSNPLTKFELGGCIPIRLSATKYCQR